MSNGIVRRPAVPPPVRIRRDVANLASSDPILVFYEKAIAVMQRGNRLDDPLSWRYQAAIHDYPLDPNTADMDVRPPPAGRRADPNASASDRFPGDQDTFWGLCEHSSWFFLSWHRIYLHFFEKTIMKIVANLPGGPSDWALPYWNVSTSSATALLPEPFRIPADPAANHLFVRQRTANANGGRPFLDVDRFGRPDPSKPDTNLDCLKSRAFKDGFGGPASHGHGPGGASGTLEFTPHNAVHSNFGGGSFMLDPRTAALDPIFWLHHCNIDRLWEVWVQRQKQMGRLDRNPKDSDPGTDSKTWLDEKFNFHDENGTRTAMTSREVMDTRQPPLSYEFEDISDPFKGAP